MAILVKLSNEGGDRLRGSMWRDPERGTLVSAAVWVRPVVATAQEWQDAGWVLDPPALT